MSRPIVHGLSLTTALLLLALASACAEPALGPDPAGPFDDEGDTVFLTRPVQSSAHMEALYQGRVVKDAAGCIRLDTPADATVIWPFGASLQDRAGQSWVVDVALNDIGVLGGEFRFGGGFVSRLHSGLGFSAAAEAQIAARCPGQFWIVGETS